MEPFIHLYWLKSDIISTSTGMINYIVAFENWTTESL